MSRYPFLFILAIVLGFSACQVVDQDPGLEPPEPALEDGEICSGYSRTFDLVFNEVPGSDSSAYTIEIATGNYITEPCMCRVVGYRLRVTKNTHNDWDLYPFGPPSILFGNSTGPQYDTLKIDDIEQFMGDGGMGSGNLNAKNVLKSGTMTRAGGLCIIENYDGTFPPGAPANGPLFVQVPNSPPGTGYTTHAYIPIGMTQP